MTKIQIISFIGCFSFFCLIIYSICRKKIKEAYALLWIVISLILVLLTCFESLLSKIATLFGIQTPVNMLFIGLIFGIMLLLFQHLILFSKNHDRICELTQEVALLKAELEQSKNTMKNKIKTEK